MGRTIKHYVRGISGLQRLGVLALALIIAGCTPPPKPEPPAEPETLEPATSTPALPKRPPAKAGPGPATPQALDVDILVSADLPAYLAVARALRETIPGSVRTHFMKGDPRTAPIILPRIRENTGDQVVGIGLLAARAAQSLPDRQVVFCQVFNYGDAGLVADNSKGIALVPGPLFQLGTWKTLQPRLTRVGLLIGPNQAPLIAAANDAAETLGIELVVREVTSDKAMLVALNEIGPQLDGLWLLPDNRILSTTALRALMSYSLKHGITVAGFDHQLLSHGALLTLTPRHDDIARTVLERLQAGKGKAAIPGPGVVFLDAGDVRVNARMAERLDLVIPPELRITSDAP